MSYNQWKDTSTLQLHGYWEYDLADNYVKILSIDRSLNNNTIDPKTPTLLCMYVYVQNMFIVKCSLS